MKISQILFAVSILALLFGTSCKKDNPGPQLPPITTTGANTFGCLINGEPVVFNSVKQISNGLQEDVHGLEGLPVDSSDLWLHFESDQHSVDLFLNDPFANQTWSLNKFTYVYPVANKPKDYIRVDGFISSDQTQGEFRAQNLSQTYPIFSGTFEYECVNPKTCDSLKITNGRLDVNLKDFK
ncbi:MAG TPA: hypothetical protein PLK63_14490 [Catalimonadaceae bacterium]|nr:hypothetical protein [Catalimonadaceae bacterium]